PSRRSAPPEWRPCRRDRALRARRLRPSSDEALRLVAHAAGDVARRLVGDGAFHALGELGIAATQDDERRQSQGRDDDQQLHRTSPRWWWPPCCTNERQAAGRIGERATSVTLGVIRRAPRYARARLSQTIAIDGRPSGVRSGAGAAAGRPSGSRA